MSAFGKIRRGFAVLACVAGLSVGLAAESAHAQRGGVSIGARGGMGNGFTPSVSKADLKKFAAVLSLDELQTETCEQLLAAFQAEHDVIAKQARKEMDRIRVEFEDSQDPSVFRDEMPKVLEAYRTESEKIEKQFFDDMKLVLNAKQTERWPKVERLHRRLRSLPAGMLSGESVDLVATVDQLKLTETPPDLAAVLDRYEADLDRALIERDRIREERTAAMMRGAPGGGGGGFNFDFEQIRKDMAEMRKAGIEVCEINQRYARSVEATLPEEYRGEFAQQVQKETFPRVYRDTHTGKCLKAATEFSDLSADQKSAISQLVETYDREVKSINGKWADAIQASEADGGGDPMSMFMGGGEDSAVSDARKAKRELDKVSRDKLLAILNEDQAGRLPEREDDGPGGGMMFRMGG